MISSAGQSPVKDDKVMFPITDRSDQQKVAEAKVESFREDLGPFVVAAETTRMAMVFADATNFLYPIIFANDSYLALTGYEREEVLGQRFNFLMVQATNPAALAQIDAEFLGESTGGAEILYRKKNGHEFWGAVIVSPVRDKSGKIVQYFASFVDLTAHKKEQSELKMLVEELNHRVKNILSTVQSIIWQALRSTSDPEAIRAAIESRLFALSRSHDLLTRGNWKSTDLMDVLHDVLAPFAVAGDRLERISMTGENLRFQPRAALALSIAINELATNAVKYGSLSNEAGSVLITWQADQSSVVGDLVIYWQEQDGPPVTPPSHKGFGSRVIERGLAHELGGTVTLDYRPAGLLCTINIPASSRAAVE